MHAEIKFTPVEGAKYVNKAMVRTYDSQGIKVGESEIFKAGSETEKDQLEAAVDIPMNGYVEIESQSTTEVDSEQKAAVPPEEQQSEQVTEELKKREEDTKKRRAEARHEAALERGLAFEPPMRYPGEKAESMPSTLAGGTASAHVEKKDDKLDARANPSTQPAHGQPGGRK